ncbi:hypothetical protein NLD30_04410 [SCandidatus Aminicenantes bacterium Aminicenantia_JdfR_composite]|jgi:hypothetical protein|nr:hypothetical protein [SCandidatus Aminicenantes bacterium Aminicenantia_JdfR_composite]MCP2596672.1 hypothetical protein [Candidatus Aminicenantes bacterium AC-335-G13]
MNQKILLLIGLTFFVALIIFSLIPEKIASGTIKTIEQGSSAYYEDSPFGFHTSLIRNEYPPYKSAQDLGVKWERPGLYAFWFLVQPTQTDIDNGIYHWEKLDEQYKKIPKGLNILGNIAIEPHKKESDIHSFPRSFLPRNLKKYQEFVKKLIDRYDGNGKNDMPNLSNPIKYWQIDNEPPAGKRDYAQFLKITYQAIKEQNPEIKILIGGVPGFPKTYLLNFELNYKPILQELNGYGFDIFDFHWYGNATGDYKKMEEVYYIIRQELINNKFSNPEIWITEMGSYSGKPKYLPFQSEEQQALDLIKRYVYSIALGIKKIFWAWGLMEGFKHDNGYFDHTGLIYDGEFGDDMGRNVKKLAYYTYKLMVDKLEESNWNKIETIINGIDNIYAYKFIKKNTGKSIYVLWWDYFDDIGSSKTITLNVDFTGYALVTNAIPNAESGAYLNENDYPNFFETQIKSVIDRKITLTLGKIPVFVEGIKAIRKRR